MSDNQSQSGKSAAKKSSPVKIALIGAGATVLALINLVPGGEAPSQAVMLLQYVLLGAGLIALAGGFIVMAGQK